MNNKIYILIILGLMLVLSSCTKSQEEIIDNNSNQVDDELEEETEDIDEIVELINSMTLDEKIGQLLIIGFNGTSIDEQVETIIEKYHIGGFILFKENISNIEQTTKLLNTLKDINKTNPIPLFLSIDEEGGRVRRLPYPFLKLPTAKKIGDINDKNISFQYGKILGKRIKSMGFNMNFAPVMDVNSNPQNPVIGDRAFGSTVDVVSNNGIQVMKGIISENIIPVIKHFPGHGDTFADSHINIPVVDKGLTQIEQLELIPFTSGIEAGVDGIMIGHIMFTQIDDIYPATLSKKIITDILREKLSFDGVIISDDMTMGAIAKNYKIEEAAISYLKAGGDILLICHGHDEPIKVIQRIKEEVERGNITEEELDEKLYRILKLKDKYNISDETVDSVDIQSINQDTQLLLDKIKKFK